MMELHEKVLKKIKPTEKELEKQGKIEKELIKKIMNIKGKHLKAMLCGSSARNTHLRNDNDLDFFVFFPKNLKRKEFEKQGLRIGRLALKGYEHWEEFAEHPYIKGCYKGFDIEIIPTYNVKKAELLQSAVDRSPFHMAYLKNTLTPKLCDDIRLFKQFLKGINAYGAKIKVSSMPGYLTELIILNYGSFQKALKAISAWKKFEVIDIENYYQDKEELIEKFKHHLIVIDPTDENRNVAAALSFNQFARIIAAARQFLKKPSVHFFFGKKIKLMPLKEVKSKLKEKEFLLMELPFPKKIHPDIVHGQLKRIKEKMRKQLILNDFDVVRITYWSDDKNKIIFIVDLTFLEIEKVKKRIGPEIMDEKNSLIFIQKHKKVKTGPRIENGRWVLEVKRKNFNASDFLIDYWKKEKGKEKNPIKKVLSKIKVYQKEKALKLYKKNREFALFLSDYLKGKERFLDY